MAPLVTFTIETQSLLGNRMVTVFLPPGYRRKSNCPVLFCADGQAIQLFSHRLSDAIEREGVTPVVLIGVHSGDCYRPNEYLYGVDDERFEAHEHFFTNEVYHWAIREFDLSIVRESCGVFGFSHGGSFALSMGMRHREKYGVVIALSMTRSGTRGEEESDYAQRPIAKYYLSAGTREKPLCRIAREVAKVLRKHGVDCISTERCAGHEVELWEHELPEAIRWSFPHRVE